MSLRNLYFLSLVDPVVGNIARKKVIVIVVGNDDADDLNILLTRLLLNPHMSQLGISFDTPPLCFAHSALAADPAAESAHTTISFLLNRRTQLLVVLELFC